MKTVHSIPRRRLLAASAVALDSKQLLEWNGHTEQVVGNAGQTSHPPMGASRDS